MKPKEDPIVKRARRAAELVVIRSGLILTGGGPLEVLAWIFAEIGKRQHTWWDPFAELDANGNRVYASFTPGLISCKRCGICKPDGRVAFAVCRTVRIGVRANVVPSKALEAYLKLEQMLIQVERFGDQVRDLMDPLWYELTDADQKRLRVRGKLSED